MRYFRMLNLKKIVPLCAVTYFDQHVLFLRPIFYLDLNELKLQKEGTLHAAKFLSYILWYFRWICWERHCNSSNLHYTTKAICVCTEACMLSSVHAKVSGHVVCVSRDGEQTSGLPGTHTESHNQPLWYRCWDSVRSLQITVPHPHINLLQKQHTNTH